MNELWVERVFSSKTYSNLIISALRYKRSHLESSGPCSPFTVLFFSLFVQIIKCVDYLQKHKDKSNFLKAAASATQNTPNIKRFIFQTKILRQSAPTQTGFMINANKHSYWNWFTFIFDGVKILFAIHLFILAYFSFKFQFKWFYWPFYQSFILSFFQP